MAEIDFDVLEFAGHLAHLEPHLPISDEFELAILKGKQSLWSSQQDHMVGWFNGQSTTGFGAYSRNTPNFSAKRTYNRLQSPEGMLWIAEALGVDPALVKRVADKTLTLPRRSQCAYIRSQIPWNVIAEHVKPYPKWWEGFFIADRNT